MATANLFFSPTCSSLPLKTVRWCWSIRCRPNGASLPNFRPWTARPGIHPRWLETFSSCAMTRKRRVTGCRCRLSRNDAVENGSATVAVAQFGVGMCLARSEHEVQSSGRRFCRRDSVWTAATCRRFCPRAQAKPPLIRPCREQKRQQAGAVKTLARDTGRVQSLAFGDNSGTFPGCRVSDTKRPLAQVPSSDLPCKAHPLEDVEPVDYHLDSASKLTQLPGYASAVDGCFCGASALRLECSRSELAPT